MSIRILFLAARLQPFLVSGIRSLLHRHDVEIVLYCQYPENIELFDLPEDQRLRIFFYNNTPDSFFVHQIKTFNPQIVFCAGWMYHRYLLWCKSLVKIGARTICAMDTQWQGNFKQKLLTRLSPFTLLKCFSHAWVPGERQREYAIRLGFDEKNILNNLYTPDTDLFQKSYALFKEKNLQFFPKRFVYVGRLEAHKVDYLLKAFAGIEKGLLKGWKLHIYGDGPLSSSESLNSPFIQYHKAVPQKILAEMAANGGVFCLCSYDEPWGTVVQEFASAGMPLVVSKQCGSSLHFLKDNGILCDGTDVDDIRNALLQIIALNDTRLFEMVEKSHQLASATNSVDWVKELMSLA